MLIKSWHKLPDFVKNDKVYPYYRKLRRKNFYLFFKRLFDIIVSLIMLILLSLLFVILAIAIKSTSKGPVFFRQERVTQFGKKFRIFKFRTMVANAEAVGAQVTGKDDVRITKVGKLIRKCRLDEIPQLFNILGGSMTFVGTRPEVPKYVDCYSKEMIATLLLPAGITSMASIKYKDEDELIANADNPDEVYVTKVLPGKMEYNLRSLDKCGFFRDIGTMFLYNNLRYKAEMLEIAIYPALEYQDNKHEPLCA